MLTAFLPLFCPLQRGQAKQGRSVKGQDHWQLFSCDNPAMLRANWPEADRQDGFWLSKDVLTFLLEQPQGLQTQAIILRNSIDGQQILLTAQTFSFRAANQVSNGAKGLTSSFDLRRLLLRPFSFKILALGQFLTSGSFSQDGLTSLSPTTAATLLPAVAETLMRARGGYAAVLLKDLYPTQSPTTKALLQQGFYELPADPSMQLNIAPQWSSLTDYQADLTSKYRVRARRARTKLQGITRRRLSPTEVTQYQDRCYELFQQVSQGADFNAANLTKQYFPWLANIRQPTTSLATLMATVADEQSLASSSGLSSSSTRFHGYFDEAGHLVGFTTAIPNYPTYHAHFLGLDENGNQQHHLYHNMLFDLLEDAITGGFATLDYGRTALEIKSSLGAIPVDYAVLIKARYDWLNRLIPVFTPAVYTAPAWTPRNPFRKG